MASKMDITKIMTDGNKYDSRIFGAGVIPAKEYPFFRQGISSEQDGFSQSDPKTKSDTNLKTDGFERGQTIFALTFEIAALYTPVDDNASLSDSDWLVADFLESLVLSVGFGNLNQVQGPATMFPSPYRPEADFKWTQTVAANAKFVRVANFSQNPKAQKIRVFPIEINTQKQDPNLVLELTRPVDLPVDVKIRLNIYGLIIENLESISPGLMDIIRGKIAQIRRGLN